MKGILVRDFRRMNLGMTVRLKMPSKMKSSMMKVRRRCM